ncbi:MAG: glycosyltransferase [Bacteroidia bacterium]
MRDLRILETEYDVQLLVHTTTKGLGYIYELIKFTLIGLKFFSQGGRLFYSNFTDLHALSMVFFSRFTSLKTFITIGGYEVDSLPHIGYGARIQTVRRGIVDYVIRNSTVLLPKSDVLKSKAIAIRGTDDGVITLHNGFDIEKFYSGELNDTRLEKCLTIALVNDERTFLLKGIDKVVRYAESNDRIHFTVVGVHNSLHSKIPKLKNLDVLEYCEHSKVQNLYRNHKYYLLSSLSEGMPNVLCEAIFCGCIPISYNVGNADYIMNDPLLILEDDTLDSFEKVYNYARNMKLDQRAHIISRAENLFSIEVRREKLLKLISGYN